MFTRAMRKITRTKVKVFDTIAAVILALVVLAYFNADAQTNGKSVISIEDCNQLLDLAEVAEVAQQAQDLIKQRGDQLQSEREFASNVIAIMVETDEEQYQLIADLIEHIVAAEALATEYGTVLVKGKSLDEICDSRRCKDKLMEIARKEKAHMKRTKEFEHQVQALLDRSKDRLDDLRKVVNE